VSSRRSQIECRVETQNGEKGQAERTALLGPNRLTRGYQLFGASKLRGLVVKTVAGAGEPGIVDRAWQSAHVIGQIARHSPPARSEQWSLTLPNRGEKCHIENA
jgi:hypothetical protein